MESTLNILKALADESRLRMLNLLYEGELCVCDIERVLKISQTNVSRHLSCLKNAGLISAHKQAQWVHYSLNRSAATEYIDTLIYDVLRKDKVYRSDLVSLKNNSGACTSRRCGTPSDKKGKR